MSGVCAACGNTACICPVPAERMDEIHDEDDLRGMLPNEIVAAYRALRAERDSWKRLYRQCDESREQIIALTDTAGEELDALRAERDRAVAPITLRSCREAAMKTQAEAAAACGVTRQAVAAWEAGTRKPSAVELVMLARLYRFALVDMLPAVPGADAGGEAG
jgi:DNA-binding transcriptional regulator YiaG